VTEPTPLTIGEVAEAAGLRTSAIRYYEAQGLLRPAARVGGRRRFEPDVLDRLAVIAFCRELGFTLDEIRRLLEPPGRAAQRRRWQELVEAKLAELAHTAARVEAMREVLRRSQTCDCIDVQECAERCAASSPTAPGGIALAIAPSSKE
jgi:MerR family redox-sensitive transcriptional activator SoxR